MKFRPLLMKYYNVWAVMQGFKTETRRLTNRYKMEAGDKFWVRQQFVCLSPGKVMFRAELLDFLPHSEDWLKNIKWKSPIIMPKVICPLILNLSEVRQERLGDITEAGAIAEGVGAFRTPEMIDLDIWPHFQRNGEISQKGWDTARLSFMSLWAAVGGNWEQDKEKMIWVFKWDSFEVIK